MRNVLETVLLVEMVLSSTLTIAVILVFLVRRAIEEWRERKEERDNG